MTLSLRVLSFLPVLAPLLFVSCGGGNAAPAGDAAVASPAAPLPEPAPAPDTPATPPTPAAPGAADELAWIGQGPEPFDVKAYLASRAEPPDNAAPLYMAAFASIDGAVGGEDARPLEGEIRTLSNLGVLAAGSAQRAPVEQVLVKAAAALKQIDAAQAKPQCLFPTEFRLAANLNFAQASRTVARLCVLGLYAARQNGDFKQAESALRRGLRMSRDLQPRGQLVSQLVSMSNDSTLLSGLETITLNDPKLTAPQCDAILQLLIEHEQSGRNPLEEGLKVEYINTRNTFYDLQTGRMTLKDMIESLDPTGNLSKMPLPEQSQAMNFDAVIPTINQMFAKALQTASGPYTPGSSSRPDIAKMTADAKAAIESGNPAAAQSMGIAMMLTASLDPVKESQYRTRAHLAGTQMLVALQRYKLAHDDLPPDLATAAAESALKTVPSDPYSGEPLKYVVVDGRPTIYSIGKDQQDDGGLVDWKSSTQPGDFLFVLGQPSQSPGPAPGKTAGAAPARKSKTGKPVANNPSPKTPQVKAPAVASPPPATADDAPEIRIWTSSVGTTIEAELLAVEGPNAVLKKKDGSEVRVPLSKLSKFDQQWIKNNAP